MVAVGPATTGRTWRSEVSYSRNSGPRPGSVGKGADGQDRIPSTLGPATMRAVQRPEEEAGNQLKPGDDAGRATARGGGPPAAARGQAGQSDSARPFSWPTGWHPAAGRRVPGGTSGNRADTGRD